VQASRETPESGLIRRWIEVLAFVGVWMGAGVLLDMSLYAYLLLGIPLTAGFQLFVRKRPIKDLWVRGGAGLSLRRVSLKLAILAILLAIYPFYQLVRLVVSGVSGQGLDTILFVLAAIVGAGAAAYALGQFRRETWRYLGLCLATAGLLGVLLFAVPHILAGWSNASTALPASASLGPVALLWIEQLLLLIPVVFMMEEVTFRGAIDSHVYHPGSRPDGVESSTVYGIASAIMVSVLWGLWHLPIIPLPPQLPHASVFEHIVLVGYLEWAVGPFLSLFWRRSGNLMVPGFAHATIDSFRNALGGTP
jgi:membrane protease YdiL (CAAX protease family)